MIRQVIAESIETSLASAHQKILEKLIFENLLKNGNVSLEEAQFFDQLVGQILYESSHLVVPSAQEILEEMEMGTDENSTKVLVDPETGEKYIYNGETGELVQADDDVDVDADADVPAEEDLEDVQAEEDLENVPAEEDLENAEDVSASDAVNESTVVQLNENELLVEKLLNTLKK